MGLLSGGGIIGAVAGGVLGGPAGAVIGSALGDSIFGGGSSSNSYSAGPLPVLDMNSSEYQQKLRDAEINAIQSMLGRSTQSTVDLLNYASAPQSNQLSAIQSLRNSTYETIR